MSELTNQIGDVGNDGLLQQGEAAHDGCKDPKNHSEESKIRIKPSNGPEQNRAEVTFHDVFILC